MRRFSPGLQSFMQAARAGLHPQRQQQPAPPPCLVAMSSVGPSTLVVAQGFGEGAPAGGEAAGHPAWVQAEACHSSGQ